MEILSKEELIGFRNYKYHGSNNSAVYLYFYKPLAHFLGKRVVPKWVAPNLITLTGFSFVIFNTIITFGIYGSKFEQEEPRMPNWWFLACSINFFMYKIHDDLDGY